MRHLGKAHAQLLSHRAPRSTRIPHALSRITDASAAKPSHCILHCARRCRLLGASVGALNARRDAAALGAHRTGLLRARRGYLVASLVSASAARLLWSTSGPKGPRRRFRRRVPVNPGRRAGEAARETSAGCAGRRATGDLPPQIRPEAFPGASLAPLRPRGVAPGYHTGPSHAGWGDAPGQASHKSAQEPKEWPGGCDKVPPRGLPGAPRWLATVGKIL